MIFDIENALTRPEALEAIISRWTIDRRRENVSVHDAAGRILAQDCVARYGLPVCRVSALDGIAVRSADFAAGTPDTSKWVKGDQYVAADTGDDFPDGYDAVIAAENISYDENGVLTLCDDVRVHEGSSIRPAGATFEKDELLCEEGTRIRPEDAALLAAGGWSSVPVYEKPRVAYIPTGDELIDVGVVPERGQNVQSNGVMLEAYLRQWGAQMIAYDIVPDEKAALGNAIDRALGECDILLINGGSSRGHEDFNSELLQERASYFAHGIKAVPGRPIGISMIEGKPALNIPGPMIAAWFAGDWLLHALLCHYCKQPMPPRTTVDAVHDAPLNAPDLFERLARMTVSLSEDGVFHATSPHDGTLASNIRCVNGFVSVPAGTSLETGMTIPVEVFANPN